MTQYYFDSNVVFTFLVSLVIAAISDKPFYSLVHLKKDYKAASRDEKNSIANFKSSVFQSQGHGHSVGGSMRYIDVPNDGQSIHGTSYRGSGNLGDNNYNSFRNLNERSGHMKGTVTSADAKEGGSIRLMAPQEIDPVHADARCNTGYKGSKPSPNSSNNRITGLEDFSGDTMRDRSTRAQTGFIRDTER